jgi:hypothetical protein
MRPLIVHHRVYGPTDGGGIDADRNVTRQSSDQLTAHQGPDRDRSSAEVASSCGAAPRRPLPTVADDETCPVTVGCVKLIDLERDDPRGDIVVGFIGEPRRRSATSCRPPAVDLVRRPVVAIST